MMFLGESEQVSEFIFDPDLEFLIFFS